MKKDELYLQNFLKDLDKRLSASSHYQIYVIGGGAITLHYDPQNRTSDLDVIEADVVLENVGGKGTSLAKKHGVYVSSLAEINFSVPPDWKKHCKKLTLGLRHLDVYVPMVEDIILGKLARMEPKDFDDIFSLKELGLLLPQKLLARLNENQKELKNLDYRNNVKLMFEEVFGRKVKFQKGIVV